MTSSSSSSGVVLETAPHATVLARAGSRRPPTAAARPDRPSRPADGQDPNALPVQSRDQSDGRRPDRIGSRAVPLCPRGPAAPPTTSGMRGMRCRAWGLPAGRPGRRNVPIAPGRDRSSPCSTIRVGRSPGPEVAGTTTPSRSRRRATTSCSSGSRSAQSLGRNTSPERASSIAAPVCAGQLIVPPLTSIDSRAPPDRTRGRKPGRSCSSVRPSSSRRAANCRNGASGAGRVAPTCWRPRFWRQQSVDPEPTPSTTEPALGGVLQMSSDGRDVGDVDANGNDRRNSDLMPRQ